MRKMDYKTVITENQERLAALHSAYDPISGLGSPIQRFKLHIDEQSHVLIPEDMRNDRFIKTVLKFKSIKEYIKNEKPDLADNAAFLGDLLVTISKIRAKYDFEFFAATRLKIIDGLTALPVFFVLNKPQRDTLAILEDMRIKNLPIRAVLLKARQWGGSTLIQAYMAWIQIEHKLNWNSAICANVENQARYIRGMYSKFAEEYPKEVGILNLRPYEGSSKNRVLEHRGNIIGIGSVEEPDNLRTFRFNLLHLSEVGLWKETPGKKPEDLVQALRAAVPRSIPSTMIIIESTAKGEGNFFHREYLAAKNNTSGYKAIFIPWYKIEKYEKGIDDYEDFIKNMGDYDWKLWGYGATLEGINWYKDFKMSERYSDIMMQSEFPSDDTEAFTSTGSKAFRVEDIEKQENNIIEPLLIGELIARATKGEDALKDLLFEKNLGGNLYIWALPDTSIQIDGRYVIFGDVGGKTSKADFSVLRVLDRYWMIDGGKPEFVATWRGHLDQDLFAWKGAQLSAFYNNGLFALEINSLRNKRQEGYEGEHALTVLDEIAPFYKNLYARIDVEKVRKRPPVKYGFHTNLLTKPILVDTLNACLRDDLFVERDRRAIEEFRFYESKPDGSYGAIEGQHDDLVITSAGDLWLCFKHLPLPKEAAQSKHVKGRKLKIISEASI